MSRVGKEPVVVPSGVTVQVASGAISVTGPKGSSTWAYPDSARVVLDQAGGTVQVSRTDDRKQSRANHGLTRALIANMVKGVTEGFQRRLLIYGTGYNCKTAGRILHLNVGFSGRRRGLGSQFELPIPEGIEVVIEKEAARGDADPAQLLIKGVSKQQVGQFAAEVRALRKTEPYKGKGIRYEGEYIKRKQGKSLTGGA